MNGKKRVVVIGAGISGLAAAWKLVDAGFDVTILEKESYIGGLAGTIDYKGYFLDFGPHGLHANNPEIVRLFKKLLRNKVFTYKKNNAVKYLGKYFRYPLKPQNVLLNMNPFRALYVGLALIWAKVMLRVRTPKDRNAKEWIVARFGTPMYKIFFKDYTTKVWGVGPEKLAAKFAEHRIPEISFKDLFLRGLLNIRKSFSKDHKFSPQVVELYYPTDGGAGRVAEEIVKKIVAGGGKVLTNAEVTGLSLSNDKVTSVEYTSAGVTGSIEADTVASSMPLNMIMQMFNPPLDESIIESSKKLKNRSLVIVNLIVKRKSVFDEHSIYFTDRIFNRISDLKNYNPNMFEKGISALQAEITCEYDDKLWNKSDKELVKMVVNDCKKENFLEESDVIESYIMRLRHAYNRYEVGFENALANVAHELTKIKNLYSYGRQGLFRYVDIDLCIENGFEIAKIIKEQNEKKPFRKFDFEKVEYI